MVKRLMILFLLFMLAAAIASADLSIHFLDVGQGDAVICTCDGKVMMIDGGRPESSQMIYSYLRDLGIEKIDIMVLTHPHSDHVGGLSAALSACDTGIIYTPIYYYNDPAFLRFRDMAAERNLPFVMPLSGTSFSFGDARVTVLAPYKLFGDTNDNSLVLRIAYGTHTFLFTGDAEVPEEQEILGSGAEIASTVLKVGHHGSGSSSSEAFLKAVHPKIALIGVGPGNTYGHPALDVLSRLRDLGSEIYRTDLHGTVILTSDGKNLEITTERQPTGEEDVYTLSWAMLTGAAEEEHPPAEYYVGNVKSQKFHLPECEGALKMSEKNKMVFDTREEAIAAGYQPCGTCHP